MHVLIFFLLLTASVYAKPVGKFTYVKGKVDVIREKVKKVAFVGMEVFLKDVIRARSGSKAEITFNNGNILRIAQNTKVEITEYIAEEERSSSILSLFRGKIQSIVQKRWARKIARFAKKHKYEVHTPFAVVGVKGTNFFTFHKPSGTGAIFKEGRGYCYPKRLPERIVIIEAGQAVFVRSPLSPPQVKSVSKEEIKRFEKDTVPEKKKRTKPEKKGETVQKKITKKTKGKKISGKRITQRVSFGKKTAKIEEKTTLKIEEKPVFRLALEAPRTETKIYIPITETEPEKTIGEVIEKKEVLEKEEGEAKEEKIEKKEEVEEEEVTEEKEEITGKEKEEEITEEEKKEEITEEEKEETTTSGGAPIDNIPPEISFLSTPPEITNSDSARFSWKSSEPATFYYRIDGGEWKTTSDTYVIITDLSEGNHIFELKAVDQEGNQSDIISYSWTTDYTAPLIEKKAIPTDTGTKIKLLSNEYAKIEWTFDGSSGSYSGTELLFEDVAEGSHLLKYRAEDRAGNVKEEEISFDLKRYTAEKPSSLDENIKGEGSSFLGIAEGKISAILNDDWGSWKLYMSGDYSGEHKEEWSLNASGYIFDSSHIRQGYWIYEADGRYSGSEMNGSSFFRILTKDSFGEGYGEFSGTLSNLTWSAESSGSFSHSELLYSGRITGTDSWDKGPYWSLYGGSDSFSEIEDTDLLIGGIKPPWKDPSTVYVLGEYYASEGPYIWTSEIYSYNWEAEDRTTYDNGLFSGFIAGIWLNGDIDAEAISIYRSPDGDIGYMKGSFYGKYFSYKSDLGIANIEGSWTPYKISSNPDLSSDLLYTISDITAKIRGDFSGTGIIEGIDYLIDADHEGGWTRFFFGENWGIYSLIIDGYTANGGGYSNPEDKTDWSGIVGGGAYFGCYLLGNAWIPDFGYWIADITGKWENGRVSAEIKGSFVSTARYGEISGDLFGYYDNQGNWASSVIGVYKGKELFSSSSIDGEISGLISGVYNSGHWENYDTHDEYTYSYVNEGYGFGKTLYFDSTYFETEKTIYFPDHTYVRYTDYRITKTGDWPSEFTPSLLYNHPDPIEQPDLELRESEGWSLESSFHETYILSCAGSISASLGIYIPEEGPESFWDSTEDNPSSIILIGKFDIDESYLDKGGYTDLLFGSEIITSYSSDRWRY